MGPSSGDLAGKKWTIPVTGAGLSAYISAGTVVTQNENTGTLTVAVDPTNQESIDSIIVTSFSGVDFTNTANINIGGTTLSSLSIGDPTSVLVGRSCSDVTMFQCDIESSSQEKAYDGCCGVCGGGATNLFDQKSLYSFGVSDTVKGDTHTLVVMEKTGDDFPLYFLQIDPTGTSSKVWHTGHDYNGAMYPEPSADYPTLSTLENDGANTLGNVGAYFFKFNTADGTIESKIHPGYCLCQKTNDDMTNFILIPTTGNTYGQWDNTNCKFELQCANGKYTFFCATK